MNPRLDARWPEVEALLDRVLERPPSERADWLHAHCEDGELRALVGELLAADAAQLHRREEFGGGKPGAPDAGVRGAMTAVLELHPSGRDALDIGCCCS